MIFNYFIMLLLASLYDFDEALAIKQFQSILRTHKTIAKLNSIPFTTNKNKRNTDNIDHFMESQKLFPSELSEDRFKSLNFIVNNTREDICKEHCLCIEENVSINCDFIRNLQLNNIFGRKFRVPTKATSISIKLSDRTHFRLEKGFFLTNIVNNLTIEGTYNEREQVEIETEAFMGNIDHYLEIQIINVFSVIIRSKAFSGNGKLTIRHSNDVILFPDAFENAIIDVTFLNINDLRIEERAFNAAQAKLHIISSHMDNIYRIEASLREIRFVNCSIGIINGGSFDVISINSVVFEGCRIDAIKARAITEKLYSKYLSITETTIGFIESEAIYGSGIAELILSRNRIEKIYANAIYVTAINTTITKNIIDNLGNNWLRVREWSIIIVQNNAFGVFGSMLLEETKQPVICRFNKNSLKKPLPGSLNIANTYCTIHKVSVSTPCDCNLTWLQELSDHDLRSETYCTLDKKLATCLNSTLFNALQYKHEVCDITKTILDCGPNMSLKKIDGRFFTPEELEEHTKKIPQNVYIIIGSTIIISLVVILVFIAIRLFNRPKNEWTAEEPSINIKNMAINPTHIHIFSNDDHLVIQKTMQIMEIKYPKVYKKVHERTQTLLKRDLPEKKCIQDINKIIDILDNIQNPCIDIRAFKRVLTYHTTPIGLSRISPKDSLIATNVASHDGFYSLNTSAPTQTELYDHETTNQADIRASFEGFPISEPVYAEPNWPLLPNDYASPVDKNLETAVMYTEPCNLRDLTTPYAVYVVPQERADNIQIKLSPSTPIKNRHILPTIGCVQNLPDVLYRKENEASLQPLTSSFSPLTIQSSFNKNPTISLKGSSNQLTQFPKIATEKNLQHAQLLHSSPSLYTVPGINRTKHSNKSGRNTAPLASPEVDGVFDLKGGDTKSASLQKVTESASDHSGSSNEAVEFEDVIVYADA